MIWIDLNILHTGVAYIQVSGGFEVFYLKYSGLWLIWRLLMYSVDLCRLWVLLSHPLYGEGPHGVSCPPRSK